MNDRPFNAANRKDIRAAEKAVLAAQVIDREVIAGLMMVRNGRQWVYNQLADAYVFNDPFTPEPHVHAYQAGLRARGIAFFNEIISYAPKNFVLMIEEENERRITESARRSNTDARSEPDLDPFAEPERSEPEPVA